MANAKILVVYYSRKGKNYVGGDIVDLPVGNTEVIAKKIRALTGADLFEIETVKPYPNDYTETTEVAKDELRNGVRPEIPGSVKDIASYDAVFLGYPNWWGTMPMAVFTFLESHDLTGKAVIPFCTHEGSGMGRSAKDVARQCPGSKLLPGLAIVGGRVKEADNAVADWLKKNGFMD